MDASENCYLPMDAIDMWRRLGPIGERLFRRGDVIVMIV